MLRASLATGELPPTISQLQSDAITFVDDLTGSGSPVQTTIIAGPDPKRGNQGIGQEGAAMLLAGARTR